jgi:site-specific DNA-methyltransferase (cytosine-N4-specific)
MDEPLVTARVDSGQPPAAELAVVGSEAMLSKSLTELVRRDWDFYGAETNYSTHGLHPYPAKFIPQIPRALIEELSAPGDTVGDIFCGSGTTLVEAMLLGRNAVGVDANPLACLISVAKTVRLGREDFAAIESLQSRLQHWIASAGQQADLFPLSVWPEPPVPQDKAIRFWFEPHVARELGTIRASIGALPDRAKSLAQACFSSIIVGVSRQDSDTRYVRREKNIRPGEAVRRFLRGIRDALLAAGEFQNVVQPGTTCAVHHADVLSRPDIGLVDLVVTSPPYPNAYSYHLYHMTRMLWLGMNPSTFKKREIGSHRKYSSRSRKGASSETFLTELKAIFGWLRGHLRSGGYACFVVGDSIIRGQRVRNDELIVEAARSQGFSCHANIERTLQATKKAFNPKIGKIKQERVLILQLV